MNVQQIGRLAIIAAAGAASGQVGFRFHHADPISAHPPATLTFAASGHDPRAEEEGAARARPVGINWKSLDVLTADGGGRLSLPLFDGDACELVFKHIEQRGEDDYTWFGQVAGVAGSQFILTRYQDAVNAVIEDYETGRVFVVKMVPGGAFTLRQLSRAPGPPCGSCGPRGCVPPPPARVIGQPEPGSVPDGGNGPNPVTTIGPSRLSPGPGPGGTSNLDGGSRADLLVVYTPFARSEEGGVSAMVSLIGTAVGDMNQRLANSGITTRVRLVWHQEMTGYFEDGENELSRLANGSDGFMDEAHVLRDRHRADLVALITQTMTSGGDSICGQAYRASYFGAPDYTGFSRTKRTCIDGGTFAHELGHNAGANHDEQTCQGGCASPITPYSYGYRIRRDMGLGYYQHWHDTMAYGLSDPLYGSSTRLPYFSSPNIQYDPSGPGGPYTLGSSTANVTQTIRDTASMVANWRDSAGIYYIATWGAPLFANGTALLPYNSIPAAYAGAGDIQTLRFSPGTYPQAANAIFSQPVTFESQGGDVNLD
jgi:hypothetical protein